MPVASDEPIREPAQDRIGRETLVRTIATDLRSAPNDAGFVTSLTGPWGSGKTSVLNLVKVAVQPDMPVLSFDPWLFSDAADLVPRFFNEVAGQLESHDDAGRLSELVPSLVGYGLALSQLAVLLGPGGAAATASANAGWSFFRSRHKSQAESAATGPASVQDLRAELARQLAEVGRPLVVFIDDIDRLQQNEVREVVRLVKLVGDLPYVRYLLAFDRALVEAALDQPGSSGRLFLEKIVQSPHSMPPIRRSTLLGMTVTALNDRLNGVELPQFSPDAWRNLFTGGVAPMIRTVRDVKRYANTAYTALQLTGDEVAAQDVLALAALKTFEPDLHEALTRLSSVLTGSGLDLRPDQEKNAKARALLEEALTGVRDREACRMLLRLLFPAAAHLLGGSQAVGGNREWRARLRVAHHDILDAYIHATIDENEISSARVTEVVQAMRNPDEFRRLMSDVPNERVPNLMDRILDRQDEFPEETVVEIAGVLIELEDRLPDRTGFGMPTNWTLITVLEQLYARLPDEQQTEAVARTLSQASTLSEQLRLVNRFGTFPDRDERAEQRELFDQEITTQLLDDIRTRVSSATPAELVQEPDFRWLLLGILSPDEAAGRAVIQHKASDDAFMRKLIEDSFHMLTRSNSTGTWQIPTLDWRGLQHLLGDELLVTRVGELAPTIEPETERERDAWQLAERYAGGEAPPRFP